MKNSLLSCSFCKKNSSELIILNCCSNLICKDCGPLKNFTCIKCTKTLEIPNKNPDQFLSDFLKNKENLSMKSLNCDRCEKNLENSVYCIECQKNFCVSCDEEIHKIGLYRSHTKGFRKGINLSENMIIKEHDFYCSEHPGQNIIAFCCKENKMICNVCCQGNSNKFMNLKEANQKMMGFLFFKGENLSNWCKNLKETKERQTNLLKEIQNDGEIAEKKIKIYFKELQEILEMKEEQLLSQLKFLIETQNENIYTNIHNINLLTQEMEEMKQILLHIFNEKKGNYLKTLPFLLMKLENFTNQTQEIQAFQLSSFKIPLNTTLFDQIRANLVKTNFSSFSTEISDKNIQKSTDRACTPKTSRVQNPPTNLYSNTKASSNVTKELKNLLEFTKKNSFQLSQNSIEDIGENKEKIMPFSEEFAQFTENSSVRNQRNVSPFIKSKYFF